MVSLILILSALSIFIFLYSKIWKVRNLPLSHKIFYGIFFIPLSLLVFCAILFHFVADYSSALVIYFLVTGQFIFFMISDSAGDKTAQKIRIGRMVLYSIGYVIGIVGLIFLYIVVFFNIFLFGISSLSNFYADRMVLFGISGGIIFILSLWGFQKEEQYGTGGQMKGSAFFWANIVFMILMIGLIFLGLYSILDLLFWHRYPQIWPEFNYVVGVLYLPMGIVLFILSALKLRRDYRYRKQFY